MSDDDALFADGTRALAEGKPVDAISAFEGLGDRGVVNAVVSYDRALAYAARVRAGAGAPGDLGRAVHGFEEARLLTRDVGLARDASVGLDIVRGEIARRRSREGASAELASGTPLGRALVGLARESTWATAAVVFAAALTLVIILRVRALPGRARVAANTALGLAALSLAVTASLAWAAAHTRREVREGIVVSEGARLLDDHHLATPGKSPLPEGARVRILGEEGGFRRVDMGGVVGLLPAPAVLPLADVR